MTEKIQCPRKVWIAQDAVDNVPIRCSKKKGHTGKHRIEVS